MQINTMEYDFINTSHSSNTPYNFMRMVHGPPPLPSNLKQKNRKKKSSLSKKRFSSSVKKLPSQTNGTSNQKKNQDSVWYEYSPSTQNSIYKDMSNNRYSTLSSIQDSLNPENPLNLNNAHHLQSNKRKIQEECDKQYFDRIEENMEQRTNVLRKIENVTSNLIKKIKNSQNYNSSFQSNKKLKRKMESKAFLIYQEQRNKIQSDKNPLLVTESDFRQKNRVQGENNSKNLKKKKLKYLKETYPTLKTEHSDDEYQQNNSRRSYVESIIMDRKKSKNLMDFEIGSGHKVLKKNKELIKFSQQLGNRTIYPTKQFIKQLDSYISNPRVNKTRKGRNYGERMRKGVE